MTKREEMISGLNTYLRNLADRRETGVVSAADARRYLDRKNYRGRQNTRLSIVRSVLNESNFTAVGYMPSPVPESKGRRIAAWVKQ